ncbi:MAG: hypothetical protein IJU68_00530 [Bacteroidales bacterium]|nr:hypothetical protein [Bacteroidales bacterium]
MKKIFAIVLSAVLCLGAVSCNKDAVPEGADTLTVRVALTPDPGTVPAAGASFDAVAIVHQGVNLNVDWEVSVDGDVAWISLQKTTLKTQFVGTYAGDDKEVEQPGISCTVAANLTGKKRSATIRFTTANGASAVYVLNQSAK